MLLSALAPQHESEIRPALSSLVAHYQEPSRHYHTLTHVLECLATLDEYAAKTKALLGDDAYIELELALWYHDVIYDTHRADNEAASAEFFVGEATLLGLESALVERVRAFIQMTDHKSEPQSACDKLLISIDLATLGSAPQKYAAYAKAVRREYELVPEADYRAGRAKVLQSFLDRETIYLDPWLSSRLETRARENLARELQELQAQE